MRKPSHDVCFMSALLQQMSALAERATASEKPSSPKSNGDADIMLGAQAHDQGGKLKLGVEE